MLNLIIKQPTGEYEVINVNTDMTISPTQGQQFYFDNYSGSDYTFNLVDGEKSIELVINTDPKVKILFENMVELIVDNSLNEGESKTVLSMIDDPEGIFDVQQTVMSTNFKGDDIIEALKELLAESSVNPDNPNGIVIDDFGSLTSALDAAAAGGEEGDGSTTNFGDNPEFRRTFGALNSELDGPPDNPPEFRPPSDNDSVVITLDATPIISEQPLGDGEVQFYEIIYTVNLSTIALTDMIVPVLDADGNVLIEILVPAGFDTASDIYRVDEGISEPFSDDPYAEDPFDFVASIGTVTGGGFDTIDATDTATTTIIDDDDPTTVTLSAGSHMDYEGDGEIQLLSVQNEGFDEGDEFIEITATLSNPVRAGIDDPVIIHTTHGDITITSGTTGTLQIENPNTEDVYKDPSILEVAILSVEGGGFESLVPDLEPIIIEIDDTIDTVYAQLVVVDDDIAEEDTATYKVKIVDALGNEVDVKADTDVTIKFNHISTDSDDVDFTDGETFTVTIAANSSSKNFDIATLDDIFAERDEEFSLTITNVEDTGHFENVIVDTNNDMVTTTLDDDTGTPNILDDGPEIDHEVVYVAIVATDSQGNILPTSIVNEGDPAFYKTILVDSNGNTLTSNGTVDLTFTDITTSSTDYTPPAVLTVNIGDLITTETIADLVDEFDEKYEISLSNPTTTLYENIAVLDSKEVLLEESFENFRDGRGWHVEHGGGDINGQDNSNDMTITGDHNAVWTLNEEGVEIQQQIVTPSPDGTSHAELDPHTYDGTMGNTSMSTNVSLNGNDEFVLTFAYKPRNANTSDMKVTFAGEELLIDNQNSGRTLSYDNTNMSVTETTAENGWTYYTIVYSGITGTDADLVFEGAGNSDRIGALLDAIRLEAGGLGSSVITTIIDNDTLPDARNDRAFATETGDEFVAAEDENNDTLSDSGNVISNDTGTNPLTVTVVRYGGTDYVLPINGDDLVIETTYGKLTIDKTGAYDYAIDAEGEALMDSWNIGDKSNEVFKYTLSDGVNADDQANLVVTVEGRNDAPEITSIVGATNLVIDNLGVHGLDIDVTPEDLLSQDRGTGTPHTFPEDNGNLVIDTGTGGTNLAVNYYGANAGFENILGYYTTDENGNPKDPIILHQDETDHFDNLGSNPDLLGLLTGVEGKIGFFIIPNGNHGAVKNALDSGDYELSFTPASTGFALVLDEINIPNVYYTDNEFSTDGRDHAIASQDENGVLTIGFEDLPENSTDQDYDDVVFTVTPCKTLHDSAYYVDLGKVDDDIQQYAWVGDSSSKADWENVDSNGNAVTIKAYRTDDTTDSSYLFDSDNSDYELGVNLTPRDDYAGNDNWPAEQIEFDRGENKSEYIELSFDGNLNVAKVGLTHLIGRESGSEQAKWTVFKDGVEVASGEVNLGGGGSNDPVFAHINTGAEVFDTVRFEALEYVDAQGNPNGDSSDFFIQSFQGNGPAWANDSSEIIDDISLVDVDNTHLQSATVTITNPSSADTLEFTSIHGITATTTALGVLLLEGNATKAQYEEALEAITFTTDEDPGVLRHVEVTVNDGLKTSNTASFDLYVGECHLNTPPLDSDKDVDVACNDDEKIALFMLNDYEEGGVKDVFDDMDNDTGDLILTDVRIDTLPENGTLYYINEVNVRVEVTEGMVLPENTQFAFVADEGYDDVMFAGTKADIGTIDNWGDLTGGVLTIDGGVTVKGFAGAIEVGVGFASENNNHHHDGLGLGVIGSTDSDQIESDANESLVFEFDKTVSNAEFGLASLGGHFTPGAWMDADAHWVAYLDGVEVASDDVKQSVGDSNPTTNSFTIDQAFDKIVFSTEANKNSNYSIQYMEIDYLVDDSFEYTAIDSHGLEGDGAVVRFDIDSHSCNIAPTTTDDTIELNEDTAYVLTVDDFGMYSDDDSTTFVDVKITDLPDNGVLKLNGTEITLASLPIAYSDIFAGDLVFIPTTHTDDDSSFKFKVSDGEEYSEEATTTITVTAVADTPTVDIDITVVSETSSRNFIVNGGFEDLAGKDANGNPVDDVQLTGTQLTTRQEITGWVTTEGEPMEPHAAGHAGVGVTEGENYMDLGASPGNTTITQTIGCLHEGQPYTLTFDYFDKALKQESGQSGMDSGVMQVVWNGVVVHTLQANNIDNWETLSLDVTASSGDNTLSFREIGENDDNWGIALDNVSLSTVTGETNTYTLDVDASLVDRDGSEVLTVMLEDLPAGALINGNAINLDGTYELTVSGNDFDGTVTLTTLEPLGTLELTAIATATEIRDNDNGLNFATDEDSDALEDSCEPEDNEDMKDAIIIGTYAYNGNNFMESSPNSNNPGTIKWNSFNEQIKVTPIGFGLNQSGNDDGIHHDETLLLDMYKTTKEATFEFNVPAGESFNGVFVLFDDTGTEIQSETVNFSYTGNQTVTVDSDTSFQYIAFNAHYPGDNGANDQGFYVKPVSVIYDGDTTETLIDMPTTFADGFSSAHHLVDEGKFDISEIINDSSVVDNINMVNGEVNQLNIDIDDITDMNDLDNLEIFGEDGDKVTLEGNNWSHNTADDTADFNVYTNTGANIKIYIDDDIDVTPDI